MSDDDDDDEWLKRFLEEEERLLTKGDDLQKLSVIGSLPELLKYDQKNTIAKIIPKIQQELPNSTSEFNLAVSRMFNVLIHMEIPVNLVPQILQGIENKDPMIANAWMETLLGVIPILKEPIIKNEIIKCAVSKSQLSKAVYFRVASCKILGKISVHKSMSPFEVKKDVLPLVQSLCQDCFYEVRAAMCKELPNVAQGLFSLGDAIVKVNLLPLLVELSADEKVFVRSVAIESVVAIIPYLSSDTNKGTIIPLTKKLCTRSASEGDSTCTSIANVFSMLIGHLQSHMSPTDGMWFLDYFNHISRKGLNLVEDLESDASVCMLCRQHCASCLARMANMVITLIPAEINTKWYQTFKALTADPCYVVRKAVATCFIDVARTLGAANSKTVVGDFTKLLRDEDEEVLQALVPNIGSILELFAATGVLQRETPVQATLDIGRALLKCQSETFRTHNWRLKECLLAQFERLPNCFPPDFIHQHFSPVIVNATIHGKAKPVRSQASRTLLIFLRYSPKENHRKWIREMILTHLCGSTCCYSRQMFVTLCEHALEIFSWKYFKEHFYLPLLGLADDGVSIVRLSMVKLCPILKQMLVVPLDRALQLKLENMVSKMEMMESDKDVILLLKSKLKEMRSYRGVRNDVLMEDKHKMEEEERIAKGKMNGTKTGQVIPKDLSEASKEHPIDRLSTAVKSGGAKSIKRAADGTASNPMPFLDQHFYTDAGVALPQDYFPREKNTKSPYKTSTEVSKLIESAENLTSWLNEISCPDPIIKLEEKDVIISVENVKSTDKLTEDDLKAIETSTSNMTDELKVNIQQAKPKRNSCVFTHEMKSRPQEDKEKSKLKRRSVNLPMGESRIPVAASRNRFSYHEKLKSVSDQALDVVSSGYEEKIGRLSRFTKSALNLKSATDGVDSKNTRRWSCNTSDGGTVEEKKYIVFKRFSVSEHKVEPEKDQASKSAEGTKVSGLPISVRRRRPSK